MVNKRVWNAVLGCNLKNDRMSSVGFQGKPFNITVIQVYAPTSNAEEAEVERFYEDLQDLLVLYIFTYLYICVCSCVLSCFSCVWPFVTPWTVTRQAPLPTGFSRQEYWSGLPFPPPGDLPRDGTRVSCFLHWPAGSLPLAQPGKDICITESLCCTVKINTILEINYTLISFKKFSPFEFNYVYYAILYMCVASQVAEW